MTWEDFCKEFAEWFLGTHFICYYYYYSDDGDDDDNDNNDVLEIYIRFYGNAQSIGCMYIIYGFVDRWTDWQISSYSNISCTWKIMKHFKFKDW